MTTSSPRPSPASHSGGVRPVTRISSPPVAFSATPGRRVRSDSPSPTPSPIMLHPHRSGCPLRAQAGSSSDDEDFPPSISQRRISPRSKAKGDARLLLPEDSVPAVREKRSFERTRRWAEEAEYSRRQSDESDSAEGLVDDRCKCSADSR
jgi:hypothetical protein